MPLPLVSAARQARLSPDRVPASAPASRSPEHALVADPAGEAVGVEPLEQKLRRPARDAEQVTEAGEGDAAGGGALLDEHALRLLVGRGADCVAVTDLDEPALLLEEARELAVG